MESKLEDLLLKLGQPGRLQILSNFFMIFSFMHSISMNYFISFVTMAPSHHCKLPETWEWPNNISIPQHNTSTGIIIYDQCKIYKNPFNQSLGQDDCPTGEYEYIHEDGERLSTITEWSLVCDRKYMVRIYQMSFFVGVMIGGFACGFLSDKYGRRVTWIISTISQAVLGIATAFVTNFGVSCFLLFVRGIFIQSQCGSSQILVMEMLPLQYRTISGIVLLSSPALSLALANFCAYFITDWRHQILVHSLTSLIGMIGFWFVKESFRWLLSHRRIEEALKNAQNVAKFNGITLSKNLESDLEAISDEIQSTMMSHKKQSIIDLVRKPFMRWICLIMCFQMFMAQICVYGFNFLIAEIGGDVYINYLVVAIVDLLMRGLLYFAVEKIGRTITTATTLLVMGVSNLIFTVTKSYEVVYPSLSMVSLVASIIGRVFNGMYFVSSIIQASEIFPTTVRSTAAGLHISAGRFGMLILPVILLLGDYVWKQMPFLIFGVGSFIAGVLAFFVPETQGIVIPNTIEEASKLRKRKMHSKDTNCNFEEMKVITPMLDTEMTIAPKSV